jgi:hypothetical protein
MKAGAALLLTGIGLFAISKAASLHTLASLNLSLNGFKIDWNGVHLSVLATNPTTNSVTINNLKGTVYLNEQVMGQIGPFTGQVIPASATSAPVPVTVILNAAVIILEAISIFNGSAGQQAIMKVVGVVTADYTDISFTISCKLF